MSFDGTRENGVGSGGDIKLEAGIISWEALEVKYKSASQSLMCQYGHPDPDGLR